MRHSDHLMWWLWRGWGGSGSHAPLCLPQKRQVTPTVEGVCPQGCPPGVLRGWRPALFIPVLPTGCGRLSKQKGALSEATAMEPRAIGPVTCVGVQGQGQVAPWLQHFPHWGQGKGLSLKWTRRCWEGWEHDKRRLHSPGQKRVLGWGQGLLGGTWDRVSCDSRGVKG